MRKWLRSFLAWMDKRFPEKVVITQAEFVKMKEAVTKLEAIPGRIEKIELEINKFNAAMGFGGKSLPAGAVVPFQR